ncbi:hypothetical protein E1091_12475, partial [Micromonospora fluostatini]
MTDEEILVGYDGSADAEVALAWALAEATHSGRPVRLAYVFEWLTVAGWLGPGVAPGVWPDETARREVEGLVRRAAGEAAARHPGLTVHGEVFDGPPALLLQERSAEAGLLVLGSRGHGGFTGLLVGSTAVSVSAHAHCPVVVVRTAPDAAPAGADTGAGGAAPAGGGAEAGGAAAPAGVDAEAGPVVVGVDGSECALLALGWAVERAAQRRVPLRVVRAWSPTQY